MTDFWIDLFVSWYRSTVLCYTSQLSGQWLKHISLIMIDPRSAFLKLSSCLVLFAKIMDLLYFYYDFYKYFYYIVTNNLKQSIIIELFYGRIFYIIFVNAKVTIIITVNKTVTRKLLIFKFNFQSSKKVRIF